MTAAGAPVGKTITAAAATVTPKGIWHIWRKAGEVSGEVR